MGKCVLHLYYTISQKGEKIEPLLLWSRSLKMIPFDRAYMTSHSLSVVTVALSRLVFEIRHNVCAKMHSSTPRLLYDPACAETT